MKGKLLIEPGFEAGSLYCGDCRLESDEAINFYCDYFEDDLTHVAMNPLRCQQCLDAEVKDED